MVYIKPPKIKIITTRRKRRTQTTATKHHARANMFNGWCVLFYMRAWFCNVCQATQAIFCFIGETEIKMREQNVYFVYLAVAREYFGIFFLLISLNSFFLLLVCILISELKASEHRFENWLCLDDTPLRIMCAYEPKTKKIAFMGNAFYFIGIASAFRNDKIPRGYYYQCKRDSIEVQMGEKWRTKWKNVRKK